MLKRSPFNRLKKTPLKKSPFKKKKKVVDVTSILKMYDFFLSIWKKRKHQSEISGEKLYEIEGYPSSAYFHHILLKENHEEAKLDEENIILLTIDEHNNVHIDMYRYEEINKRREKLLEKYDR